MFDIVIALAAIVAVLPLMLLIAVALYAFEGGPVLFRHQRIGLGGRQFSCLKFRTMHRHGDAILAAHLARDPAALEEWERGRKLRKDPRVSALGHFLRVSSLDELPQLFSVLRGDMAIVGPRPIVADELCRYGRYASHYLGMRPGITGLWQVSGRSSTTYRRRVACDVLYMRRRSTRMDWQILLKTVPAVFASNDAC